MRHLLSLTITLLLTAFSLSAQEKGVTPLQNPQTKIQNPETYAVVVGISDYQDPAIPDLQYAHRDAEAFAEYLRSPAGGSLDEDHLKLLLNEEATMAQFATALDWLWEVAQEGDQAIIYFSGHGDVEKKSLTQPGYLLCWDAPARVYMAGGAFPLPMLQEVISTISVQNKAQVLMVADACRSGKLSGNSVNGAQLTGSNLARQYANEVKILSCQPEEYSLEGEQWGGGRGVFSYHLIDALYGLADRNEDMLVNLLEVERYLEDKVMTEAAPHSQIPLTVGSKGTRIAVVDDELLQRVRDEKEGQLALFSGTASRGIEEEVLAEADSLVRQTYLAFQQALEKKRYLSPTGDCADAYYAQLIEEPQLQKLHSSMSRNYAAALQDDAQQVMNTMLKSGLTENVLSNIKEADLYGSYPAYLQRAAELLGEDHYMYATLQARKHFFEGKIQTDKEKARQSYFEALQWQPNLPHAYAFLVNTYDENRTDSATYCGMRAAELVPSWVLPYLQLSYFFQDLENFAEAEKYLEEAGQVDSSSVYVWYSKARFFNRTEQYEKSEYWFKRTIDGAAESAICFPCAWNDLGTMYKDWGKLEESKKAFQTAMELDSTFVLAYRNMGSIYGLQQKPMEAESYILKAIGLDSSDMESYTTLGAIYQQSGQFDKARELLERGLAQDSTNSDLYFILADVYKDRGIYPTAIEYYRQAIQLDSTKPNYYNNMGFAYGQLGNLAEEEKLYRTALALDSTQALYYRNLAQVFIKTNRPALAEEYIELAFQRDPDNLETLNARALFYLQNRRFLRAEESFLASLAIDSTSASATSNLGVIYDMTGRSEEAEAMFKKSLELDSTLSFAYQNLGFLCYNAQRFEEALAYYQKLGELNPDFPAAYFFIGAIYGKLGDWDLAFQNLERFLQLEKRADRNFLQQEPRLADFRTQTERWQALLDKYFPEENKD